MNKMVRNAMVKVNKEDLIKSVKVEKRSLLNFDVKKTGSALASVLNNSNKGIGQITYWNNSQIAMLFNPRIGRKAIENLKFLQGVNNGQGEYKRFEKNSYKLDDQNITKVRIEQADVDKVIQNIKLTNLDDPQNVKNILLDLNIIYRMYQEKTIDAAKKALEVEIKVALDTYKALSLVHYKHEFDWESKELKVERVTHNNKRVKLFVDEMSKIQDDAKDFLVSLVNSLAKQVPSITEEEKQRILQENKINSIAKDVRLTLKSAYGAICGELAQLKEKAAKMAVIDQDEADRISEIASSLYKERIGILDLVAKKMLEDYTTEERTNILQYVAYTDKFNSFIEKNTTGKLPLSILKEDYLQMVLDNYAEQKYAGYKIIVAKEDIVPGAYVFFENGKSAQGSYFDFGKEEEYATDMFQIQEINGQLYAVQKIQFKQKDFGNKLAVAVDNAMFDAFNVGSKVTIDIDKTIYIEDIAVGKVRAKSAAYEKKITCKRGVLSNFVLIGEENKNFYHFLIELDDVEDMLCEDGANDDIPTIETDEDMEIVPIMEEYSEDEDDEENISLFDDEDDDIAPIEF